MAPMGFFEEPPVQIWMFKDRVRRMGLRGIPMESESNGKKPMISMCTSICKAQVAEMGLGLHDVSSQIIPGN